MDSTQGEIVRHPAQPSHSRQIDYAKETQFVHPITHSNPNATLNPRLLVIDPSQPSAQDDAQDRTATQGMPGFLGGWPNNRSWNVQFVDHNDQVPKLEHQPVQITNAIHPIWRHANWRHPHFLEIGTEWKYVSPAQCDQYSWLLPNEIYWRMIPALRLASLLLQRSRPFMAMLLRCPVKDVGRTDRSVEAMFDQIWRPQQIDFDILDRELALIAPQYRVFSRPANPPKGPWKFGTTEVVYNADYDGNGDGHVDWAEKKYLVITGIAQEMMHQFKDENWVGKSNEARASVYANLAITLNHELCHTLWWRRALINEQIKQRHDVMWCMMPEPRMFPDQPCEVGVACTRWLFGCDIVPASSLRFTLAEIMRGDFGTPHLEISWDGRSPLHAERLVDEVGTGTDRRYQVTDRTIQDLFDAHTWQADTIAIYLIREPLRDEFSIHGLSSCNHSELFDDDVDDDDAHQANDWTGLDYFNT